MASYKGHVKVVEKLLEHGAKLENITKVRIYCTHPISGVGYGPTLTVMNGRWNYDFITTVSELGTNNGLL